MEMEVNTPDWSKDELKAYLLLFAANADFVETENEKQFIKSKSGKKEYRHIHEEFEEDTDYERIQKIQKFVEKEDYSEKQIEGLLSEMKELFKSDGEYKGAERSIYYGLKQVLKRT